MAPITQSVMYKFDQPYLQPLYNCGTCIIDVQLGQKTSKKKNLPTSGPQKTGPHPRPQEPTTTVQAMEIHRFSHLHMSKASFIPQKNLQPLTPGPVPESKTDPKFSTPLKIITWIPNIMVCKRWLLSNMAVIYVQVIGCHNGGSNSVHFICEK